MLSWAAIVRTGKHHENQQKHQISVSPVVWGEQAVRLDSVPGFCSIATYLRKSLLSSFLQLPHNFRKQSDSHFLFKSPSSQATIKLLPSHCVLWTILKLCISRITRCLPFVYLCLSSFCDAAFVRFIRAVCGFCPAVSHYVNICIFLFSAIIGLQVVSRFWL